MWLKPMGSSGVEGSLRQGTQKPREGSYPEDELRRVPGLPGRPASGRISPELRVSSPHTSLKSTEASLGCPASQRNAGRVEARSLQLGDCRGIVTPAWATPQLGPA